MQHLCAELQASYPGSGRRLPWLSQGTSDSSGESLAPGPSLQGHQASRLPANTHSSHACGPSHQGSSSAPSAPASVPHPCCSPPPDPPFCVCLPWHLPHPSEMQSEHRTPQPLTPRQRYSPTTSQQATTRTGGAAVREETWERWEGRAQGSLGDDGGGLPAKPRGSAERKP